MTIRRSRNRGTFTVMSVERESVPLGGEALAAAKSAAAAAGLPLAEWTARAAWRQAVAESAEHSLAEDLRHPEEWPGWQEDALDRIFDQGLA